MLFWIVIGICAVATTAFVIHNCFSDDFSTTGMKVFYGFLATFVGAFITLILLCGVIIPANVHDSNQTTEKTYSLQALATGTSTHNTYTGAFFVAYGESNGTRVLNYIDKASDSGFQIRRANTRYSEIYEGSAKPYVKVYTNSFHVWWLAPWTVTDYPHSYKFYVPKGSVLQDYTVKN